MTIEIIVTLLFAFAGGFAIASLRHDFKGIRDLFR